MGGHHCWRGVVGNPEKRVRVRRQVLVAVVYFKAMARVNTARHSESNGEKGQEYGIVEGDSIGYARDMAAWGEGWPWRCERASDHGTRRGTIWCGGGASAFLQGTRPFLWCFAMAIFVSLSPGGKRR